MVVSNGVSTPRLKFLIGGCYYNIVMQICDAVFTYWGTSNFGAEVEGNPLIRNLIEDYGVNIIFMIKTIIILLIFLMIHMVKRSPEVFEKSSFNILLPITNIIYTIVVVDWFCAFIRIQLMLYFLLYCVNMVV